MNSRLLRVHRFEEENYYQDQSSTTIKIKVALLHKKKPVELLHNTTKTTLTATAQQAIT